MTDGQPAADNKERVARVFHVTLGLREDRITELLRERMVYGATVFQCQGLIDPPIETTEAQEVLDRLVERGIVNILRVDDKILYLHRDHAARAETRRKTEERARALDTRRNPVRPSLAG